MKQPRTIELEYDFEETTNPQDIINSLAALGVDCGHQTGTDFITVYYRKRQIPVLREWVIDVYSAGDLDFAESHFPELF